MAGKEQLVDEALAAPPSKLESGSGFRFEVNVFFTTSEATLSVLNTAGRLAGRLGARISLIVPQVVPFPLPLAQPTIAPEFTARKARAVAAGYPGEAEIKVCLCRQPVDAALSILKPNSLVLIGGKRRLWPTAEKRLAREIGRRGHQVLFINQE